MFWIVATFASVLSAVMLIMQGYQLSADTNAYINRAQVAADREDMHEYLLVLKANMEKHGMTSGHTALVFKQADNNMALHYRTVNRIIERLDSIKEIPKSETAYQVALGDIRGTLRELPNPAMGWLWVTLAWWLLLINGALWLMALVIAATEDSQRGYNRW